MSTNLKMSAPLSRIHPLVRDLYKRALLVGRDYPHPQGMVFVREKWKEALRNPSNCPSWYPAGDDNPHPSLDSTQREKEIRRAVARGRFMVREMVGVVQLKKYRTMNQRYRRDDDSLLQQAMQRIEQPQATRRHMSVSSSNRT